MRGGRGKRCREELTPERVPHPPDLGTGENRHSKCSTGNSQIILHSCTTSGLASCSAGLFGAEHDHKKLTKTVRDACLPRNSRCLKDVCVSSEKKSREPFSRAATILGEKCTQVKSCPHSARSPRTKLCQPPCEEPLLMARKGTRKLCRAQATE